MADFRIREIEGMRQVCIDIADEWVASRRGAMIDMQGGVKLTPRFPGLGGWFKSLFSQDIGGYGEYSGTGTVVLRPSMNGFHLLEIAAGDRWIVEPGMFWACDSGTVFGLAREPALQSFWAGDGLLEWKTALAGSGTAVIEAPGPVEVVEVTDGRLMVEGRIVLARTDGLRFSSQRPASIWRSWYSRQSRMRVYSGTGRALVCRTPFWSQRLIEATRAPEVPDGLFT